jgi:MFS family permease
VTALAFAGPSQKLVTKTSPKRVMIIGMALIGAGILWTTQITPHGNFWQDLAGPFFVAGIGVALAFIPVSIGALTGVAEGDAGVASGLISTSQQLGGAIGVAVASSLAASRFHTQVLHGHSRPAALTSGFNLALWVCGLTAIVAIPVAFALIRQTKTVKTVESTQQRDVPGSSDLVDAVTE